MTGIIDWKSVAFVAPAQPPRVADIIAAVLLHFRLRDHELKQKCRRREYARARQVVMFLAREMTPASLPMIARELGGVDHTTVIWGARKISQLIAAGAEGMAAHVKAVRELVLSGDPRSALRARETRFKNAALEAQAERDAEEAIRHSEEMAKLRRIRDMADAGFITKARSAS